ncbi:hypothetical protein PPROV_000310300 [Pycnococcus provasolii]|uniref:Uncharacterized protein n=1 Tax=Pycnococcus provasolii TaxID=41880 RepID=A0A830HGC0_9CHLO|nr:hypothetical protein PPROV_000310300 [Pycnococcus provasolii]
MAPRPPTTTKVLSTRMNAAWGGYRYQLRTVTMPTQTRANLRDDLAQLDFNQSIEAITTGTSSERNQALGGLGGTAACGITAVSIATLKTTGCGLPPGPGGLIGAAEGISYLAVTALLVTSITTKVKTGRGVPNGPGGVLGLAEGLAWTVGLAGVVVLALQINDYGYVPNAVPTENAPCFSTTRTE